MPPLLKLEGVILAHALFRYPSRELMHSWYLDMAFNKGINVSAPIMMVLNYVSAWGVAGAAGEMGCECGRHTTTPMAAISYNNV